MTTRKGQNESAGDVTKVVTTCPHDCGGKCLLRAHVRNGVIIRFETDDENEPQLRACARGRASRQRTYAPDRLKYPMKRTGERGEGEFERISWDEALDRIACEMKRIKESCGPGAFVNLQYAGEPLGSLQGAAVGRLMNMFGGNLQHWGGASLEGNYWAARAMYGTRYAAIQTAPLPGARLIIMWGSNPANNLYGESNPFRLMQAKEAGARIICIDPRYTDSAAVYADEWIPIIPGTDTAMLIAMAHVMITESLHDQGFLDTFTVGFNRFREYVLGIEDGIAKTPAWAEAITGVPAVTIERLAREYAITKAAALIIGWGPGRTAYGEQYFRAANTLTAMTGNVSTLWVFAASAGAVPWMHSFTKGRNPFNYYPGATSGVTESLDPALKNRRQVVQGDLYDAILQGRAGGYPSDIKMVWVNCGNTLNQFPNTNKGVRAFKVLEFIVVSEQFMTPTARFADILLPVTTHLERNGVYTPWAGGPYLLYANKAIEPMFEAKSDFQICAELAPRLGIDNYSDRTEEEWVQEELGRAEIGGYVPTYEAFKQRGVARLPSYELGPYPSQRIRDLKNYRLPTPSGKIEIYSQEVADLNNPDIPPIPRYIETWESRHDPLAQKYPLQLITSHFKLRAHSCFDNVLWLKQLEPQRVWINTADAEARGIRDWDEVRVFNDRGEMSIPAKVTGRIMPGVVNISEGAWYKPDSSGVDRGGCPNVLTRDQNSPAGAWCTHTALVQVERAWPH